MKYIEFPECFVIALGDICFKVSPFEAVWSDYEVMWSWIHVQAKKFFYFNMKSCFY